jgi:hypothetical protein
MRMSRIWILVGAVLVLGGCTSKEEQLRALRMEVNGLIDAQYRAYGGGNLATVVQGEASQGAERLQQRQDVEESGKAAGRELLGMLKNVAGETDRIAFEQQCLSVGAGGRPAILNDKAKEFFARKDVQSACAEAFGKRRKAMALAKELGIPLEP